MIRRELYHLLIGFINSDLGSYKSNYANNFVIIIDKHDF